MNRLVIKLVSLVYVVSIAGCSCKKAPIPAEETTKNIKPSSAAAKVDLSLLLADTRPTVHATLLQTSQVAVSAVAYGPSYKTLSIDFSNTPRANREKETTADYGKIKICREDGTCFKTCETCSEEIQSPAFGEEVPIPDSFLSKRSEILTIWASSCVTPERRKSEDSSEATVEGKNPECGPWQQTKFLHIQNQDPALESLLLAKRKLSLERQIIAEEVVKGATAYSQSNPQEKAGLSLANIPSDKVTPEQSLALVAKNIQSRPGEFTSLVKEGLLEAVQEEFDSQDTDTSTLTSTDTRVEDDGQMANASDANGEAPRFELAQTAMQGGGITLMVLSGLFVGVQAYRFRGYLQVLKSMRGMSSTYSWNKYVNKFRWIESANPRTHKVESKYVKTKSKVVETKGAVEKKAVQRGLSLLAGLSVLVVGALMTSGVIHLADSPTSTFSDLLQAKGDAYIANKTQDAALDAQIQTYITKPTPTP